MTQTQPKKNTVKPAPSRRGLFGRWATSGSRTPSRVHCERRWHRREREVAIAASQGGRVKKCSQKLRRRIRESIKRSIKASEREARHSR